MIEVGAAPKAVNIEVHKGDTGTRIFMPSKSAGVVIGPRDEVGDPRRAEREDRQSDRHAVGRLVPPRVAEHVDGHADEDDGQNVGDDAERAGRDGVDDVPEHAGQPPPLPRSDDDAEGEEGETEPVATVFGSAVTACSPYWRRVSNSRYRLVPSAPDSATTMDRSTNEDNRSTTPASSRGLKPQTASVSPSEKVPANTDSRSNRHR